MLHIIWIILKIILLILAVIAVAGLYIAVTHYVSKLNFMAIRSCMALPAHI